MSIKKNLLMICCWSALYWISIPIYSNPAFADKNDANGSKSTQQQSKRKITGTVSDGNEPLVGVTVSIKGTTTGTMSDSNGEFSIEVPVGSTLEFSYLGFKSQSFIIQNQTVLDIIMIEDSTLLDDVIVVGYGVQKKSDVTGSITSISEKAIRQIPAGNIGSALQGLGSGITVSKGGGNSHPGSTPTIRIRGSRSLTGGNSPLFIVDGIPFDGSLNDISTDDIVDVQILKDASSTAIYGSRGSNGVILVTTKRGKEGKTSVTYSGYIGANKSLGKYDMFNGDEYATMKKWARYNNNPSRYTGLDDPILLADTFDDPEEMDGYLYGENTDWQDLIYSNGILTNHQVGLSGGTSTTAFTGSISYYNAEGAYKKQGMERYTIKLGVDHKLSKYVKVGLNSNNAYTVLTGVDINPISNTLQASPLLQPYEADGSLKGYLGTSKGIYNPLADFVDDAIVDDRSKLSTFTTAYLDVDFTHGFKYRLNAGVNLSYEKLGKFYGKETTKQLDANNWGNNVMNKNSSYTIDNILTFDRSFANKHNIFFTGLFSVEDRRSESTNLGYTDVIADYIQYYNPNLGTYSSMGGSFSKQNRVSFMGRLNYNYMERYLMTLTVRHDGASPLAEGNKWHTFPSAALSWNIANEPFMKNQNVVSTMKIRASYGDVGSASISSYSTLGGLSSVKYLFGDKTVSGYYPASATNKDLTWEKTRTLNFGLDYGFLNNRIHGSIEIYRQHTRDVLMGQSFPATSGILNKIMVNVGETENKGFEFNLNTVNIDGNGKSSLNWTTNFNIFLNRGKILKLASGVTEDIENNWFVGEPIGAIYNYRRLGIWQNTPEDIALAEKYGLVTDMTKSDCVIGTVKVADLNGDDKLDSKDREIIGTRQPDFEGGITNTLAYKNFDFSVVAYFKVGGLMKSQIHDDWTNTLQGGKNNVKVNYWTPDNNENYWPKPNSGKQWPDYRSTLAYMDASYLKIRTISLGYTFPVKTIKPLGIENARVYSTVSNPFTFFSEYKDKFGGLDPETDGSVGINTPAIWSFIFGVNLTF